MNSQVLIKPLITEKSMQKVADGWFTFIVDKFSNKHQIAQAVQDQFKVHVTGVRTILVKGKKKRSMRRRGLFSKSSDYKKALVRLKSGESIDLFTTEQPIKTKKT